jgi:hypothetical protein
MLEFDQKLCSLEINAKQRNGYAISLLVALAFN